MGDWVVPVSIGAGAGAGVVVVAVGLFVVRRLVLTRPMGSFDCSWRTRPRTGRRGWALGVARFHADRLDWYRIFTVSPKPGWSLARADLRIRDRTRAGSGDRAAPVGMVILHCEHDGTQFDLAMTEPAASGVSMWLESAPPGQPVALT